MIDEQLKPHSRALRKGRRSIPHQIYLITSVTRHRKPIFRNFWNGRLLVQVLKAYKPSAETLCYVVMPDYLHWLLSLYPGKELSKVVAGVKRDSARGVNRNCGLTGPLWQDGFHDHALRAEEDMQYVARYVVANPLRAGLVCR